MYFNFYKNIVVSIFSGISLVLFVVVVCISLGDLIGIGDKVNEWSMLLLLSFIVLLLLSLLSFKL